MKFINEGVQLIKHKLTTLFVLNNKETPPDFMHENIRKLSPYLRWGRSILEIDVFDDRRPWPWTLGMDFISWDEEKFGLGGYFGGYVTFSFLLFSEYFTLKTISKTEFK